VGARDIFSRKALERDIQCAVLKMCTQNSNMTKKSPVYANMVDFNVSDGQNMAVLAVLRAHNQRTWALR